MSDASWGPKWPSRNPNIVTLVRVDGLRLPIHKELVELTKILMDLTELMGYDIIPGQTWGYANRAISGTQKPSNHSQGTAEDINAPANPYASIDWHRRNARGTKPFGLQLVCNIPEQVVKLWEDHGFTWGGRYTTKPDPMHFEFLKSVSEAREITQRAIAFLSAAQSPAQPAPQPAPAPAPPPQPVGGDFWAFLDGVINGIIDGKYGNGPQRVVALKGMGFDDAAIRDIQNEVNKRMSGRGAPAPQPDFWAWVDQIINEIIAGKWGSGDDRRARLRGAGFGPEQIQAIQNEVNRRLRR